MFSNNNLNNLVWRKIVDEKVGFFWGIGKIVKVFISVLEIFAVHTKKYINREQAFMKKALSQFKRSIVRLRNRTEVYRAEV